MQNGRDLPKENGAAPAEAEQRREAAAKLAAELQNYVVARTDNQPLDFLEVLHARLTKLSEEHCRDTDRERVLALARAAVVELLP